MSARAKTVLFAAALAALLLLLPRIVTEFQLNLAVRVCIYALFAVSYNILFGQGGNLSFGHAAYFGVGAYTAAILFKHVKVPLLLGIGAGALAGALLGLLFGIFIVRLGGTYFALLTLAFNQLIYALAEKWRAVTGGADGLNFQRPNIAVPGLGTLDMFDIVNWYYFVLVVCAVCILLCWYFTKTPLGRLNLCLRENEERARFLGYNTYLAKLTVYVAATAVAGVAGALEASFQEFVATSFINLDKSAEVLFMTFIGGGKVFYGPILGATFLTLIETWLSGLTERWTIIQGAIFIVLVLYAPQGFSGLIERARKRLGRAAPPAVAETEAPRAR